MLVVAARGSGLAESAEGMLVVASEELGIEGLLRSIAVVAVSGFDFEEPSFREPGFVELLMLTAVVASRGFGLVGLSSAALLPDTGLLPTPAEMLVFPKGFGWTGDELYDRCHAGADFLNRPAPNEFDSGKLNAEEKKGISRTDQGRMANKQILETCRLHPTQHLIRT